MLKPERMLKLFIVGPKSRLRQVVSRLHSLEVAHIIEHKKDEFDLCSPLEDFEKVGSLLVQARSIMSHLNISAGSRHNKEFRIKDMETSLGIIKEEVVALIEKIKETESRISIIREQKKVLDLMSAIDVSPEDFAKSGSIKHYFGYVSGQNIGEKLSKITGRFEIKIVQHEKKALTAIFADSKYAGQFDKALADASFSEIDAAITKDLKGDSKQLIAALSKKQERHASELEFQKRSLKKLADKHAAYLMDAEKFLSAQAEKAQAPLSFGSTKEAFFLRCYLPEKDAGKVKNEIMDAASGRLHIEEELLGAEEAVPIKLNNPRGIRPFEFFTSLYSLPSYNEFDPTYLMAFTFPLFFGFMLGDVGYGIVTFALFYFLKRKFPAGKDFFNILLIASAAAIVFGVIYGEFFGYEPWHGLIVRTHDINTLMVIAIIAGAIQVNFGLVLGFILALKHHGFLHAAYEKLSWILLQISGVLLYVSYAGIMAVPVFAGYILLALSVFMLYKGEGFMGIIEIPSIVSHIVSYARLMAVGLASVFIAVLVNEFTTFLFHKGILFIPLALLFLVIGHTFNIALGILSPSLHSIRLHYVEFFTKFFKGGGIEYAPFGAEKQKSIL